MLVEKKIRRAIKVLDGWVEEEYKGQDVQVIPNWISINEDVEAITIEMRLSTDTKNIAEGIRIFMNEDIFQKLSVKQLAAYFLAYVMEATIE